MAIQIIGDVDKNRIYCSGSFTKLITTYVCLSKLSESYDLKNVLDDDIFLEQLAAHNEKAQHFLALFQNIIGSSFTIRDLCSFYSGLPYTFDLSEEELAKVELGFPFKHHSILDESVFLEMCRQKITPVYKNRCKFHYSEIAIIFLGYFVEKVFNIEIEQLYQKYIFDRLPLKMSTFSRKIAKNTFCQDLSDEYDYPSIAILDHGYFCYSNGYYTTVNDAKILLENLLEDSIFKIMTDMKTARAASGRLLNGLTVEIRMVEDDIIYGYEGLSFSGCNIWAYSTKQKKGYLTFHNNEEEVYKIIYDQALGYTTFDKVPDQTQQSYLQFVRNYHFDWVENKPLPPEFQGHYHRVKINEKELNIVFTLGKDSMIIRNPDLIKYDVVYLQGHYRIKGKDNIPGAKIGLYEAKSGHKYFLYDGTLYKKI